MSEWVRIAASGDCPPGWAAEFVVRDRVVAVFNVDGEFFALDGVCPHQGGPLGKGEMDGCIVTCPWHGWQFDVRNGRNQVSPSVIQPQIAVRVEEDSVFVQV
jgi:nitrite reductase/ring-hydroxylating ferredoxin subunit